jgi:RNB domain
LQFPDPLNIEIRALQYLIQKIYSTEKSYFKDFVRLLKEMGVFRENEDLGWFRSEGIEYLELNSRVGRVVVKEIGGMCEEVVGQGPFEYDNGVSRKASVDGGGSRKSSAGGETSKVSITNDKVGIDLKEMNAYKANIISAKTPPSTTFPQKDELELQRKEINQTVFVIDDVNAHELDDGVSLERTSQGDWIHVHIANPTAYIPPSHALSYHAQLRTSSIYLPHIHYPMMNDNLAKNLLDLGVSRCALTFSARLDGKGDICDYKVTPTLINQSLKVSYKDLDTFLSWDKIVGFKEMEKNPGWIKNHFKESADYKTSLVLNKQDSSDLHTLQKLADLHSKRRFYNGGFHPDMLNYNVKTTEPQTELLPLDVKQSFQGKAFTKPTPTLRLDPFVASQRSPAQLFVQEFMILAGRVAAKFAQEHALPVGYRTQKTMIEHHNEMYPNDLERGSSVAEMTKLLERSVDPVTGAVPEMIYRKLMPYTSPATISQIPGKHANMGLKVGGEGFGGYLKVTSPLRRYLDMHSHYQIQAALLNKPVPFDEHATMRISERMVKVNSRFVQLQRQSKRYWMLEYMRRKAFLKSAGFIAPPLDHFSSFDRYLFKDDKREVAIVLGSGGAGTHSYFITLPYYGGFLAMMKPKKSTVGEGSLVDVVFDKIDPDQGIIFALEV